MKIFLLVICFVLFAFGVTLSTKEINKRANKQTIWLIVGVILAIALFVWIYFAIISVYHNQYSE